MTQTIEQLQAKNAELTAEVERYRMALADTKEMRRVAISDMKEYRQQLTIAELDNVRLREALENHGGNYALSKSECVALNELLGKPVSREALDKYVAEKVKEAYIPVTLDCGSGTEDVAYGNINQVRRLITWLNKYFKQETKLLAITKQRDLAVEALEFIPRSGSKLGAAAEEKRLTAIAAIKESEGK